VFWARVSRSGGSSPRRPPARSATSPPQRRSDRALYTRCAPPEGGGRPGGPTMPHESARTDETRSTTHARRIARTVTLPPPEPGFLGPEHTAVEVLRPDALGASDPF